MTVGGREVPSDGHRSDRALQEREELIADLARPELF
jgi:hypothetical protein